MICCRWFLQSRGRYFALLAAVAILLTGGTSSAQEESGTGVSRGERDRLYDELAQEVEQLSRLRGVMRKLGTLVRPTVVHITAIKPDTRPNREGRRPVEEEGSGVVVEIDNELYVLTNRHVIRDTPIAKLTVTTYDGRELKPSKSLMDPASDVGVLAFDDAALIPARIGQSSDTEIGDFVVAVGSPFGLSQSMTFGIISAKGRRDLELGDDVELQDFLQTDAAINPGNSGGPLMNLRGEVIGLNTAIASSSGVGGGIGFSIPIDMVMHMAKQLVRDGHVNRAFLGVNLDPKFTPSMAARLGLVGRQGARVTGIKDGAPAQEANIQVGDVILSFNDVSVESDTHLVSLVGVIDIGSEVPVTVLRSGKRIHLTVRVGSLSDYLARQEARTDP